MAEHNEPPSCIVCFEAFAHGVREAKLIPGCFHTLCARCIDAMPVLLCPLDRIKFEVPDGGESLS